MAIGGIKKDNIDALTGTGIDGVAVVSAIFGAKDIIKDTKELLKNSKKNEARIEKRELQYLKSVIY